MTELKKYKKLSMWMQHLGVNDFPQAATRVITLAINFSPKNASPKMMMRPPYQTTPPAKDLLHPSPDEEKRKHKKKRLVQSPNSYFMDVKCPGSYTITTVFSHAQTVVLCVGCCTVLCQPTGGKAWLTEGCSFRRKQHWKAPDSR
ncbi:40S ribosomal protein S27-like [Onychomys torridus]|uniref:40S ribosomal protein S27-like n=1 Tax=Onychomys torridus TaxID=38674 RepID=UPI00167FB14D|nr:40S ribosomal protein S27-like [Onychomys torridus]